MFRDSVDETQVVGETSYTNILQNVPICAPFRQEQHRFIDVVIEKDDPFLRPLYQIRNENVSVENHPIIEFLLWAAGQS